jgi:hypothetical protein
LVEIAQCRNDKNSSRLYQDKKEQASQAPQIHHPNNPTQQAIKPTSGCKTGRTQNETFTYDET